MKLIINLVSTVLVLSMVYNVKSGVVMVQPLDVEFTCLPDNRIEVVADLTSSPELEGRYVTVVDTDQCTPDNINQLQDIDMSTQTAIVDCYNYTLYESFVIGFVVNNSFVFSSDDLITYNLTCTLPDNATVSFDNITATANPTEDTIDVEYEPEVITTLDNYVVAIQESITVNFALGAATSLDVFFALEELTYEVAGTNKQFTLVANRCPVTNLVSTTIVGNPNDGPATTLDIGIPAFGVNNVGTSTSFVVLLNFVLIFCPITNYGQCYGNDTCRDGSDQIGRKKRQDFGDDIIVEEKQEAVLVFPSQEVKQVYVDRLLEEAGLSMQPTGPKEGEICVNKTVTGALLALLLIALALCLISSVIMFVKLRKNRTDNLVKSDRSYSNKGF